MFRIITFLIVSLVVAYFAYQNSVVVDVVLATYTIPSVPLYLVVLVSVSLGFLIGFFFNLINKFFSYRALSKQKKSLEEVREENIRLTKKVHQLEIENSELRNDSSVDDSL